MTKTLDGMKVLLFFAVLTVGLVNTSMAQKNTYGLSIGAGNGLIIKEALDGDASYDLKTGISIGFLYNRKLTNMLHLQTGLNWYSNNVSVTPSVNPSIDSSPQQYNIQLLYIPIFLKVDLSKHFFINGGPIADFDITENKSITSQSGLGMGLGIGTCFSITQKVGVELSPYFNIHGLLTSHQENHPERIGDVGFKLNLILR